MRTARDDAPGSRSVLVASVPLLGASTHSTQTLSLQLDSKHGASNEGTWISGRGVALLSSGCCLRVEVLVAKNYTKY